MPAAYVYEFQVLEVYDGDTIKGVLDLGDSVYRGHPDRKKSWRSLRLMGGSCGIDTPELRGAEREDGILVRDWLRKRIPEGTWITVRTVLDSEGKYGRLLAIPYQEGAGAQVTVDGVDLGEAMLTLGLAVPYGQTWPGFTDDQRAALEADVYGAD